MTEGINTIESSPIICPNCTSSIPAHDNFCGHCGQKRRSSRIRLRDLLMDFFSGLFNIDNKIFRTLRAIWVPGKLTSMFFDGKRLSYTNPLRLYLFFSFLLFGMIGFQVSDSLNNDRVFQALDARSKLAHISDLVALDSLMNEIVEHSTNQDYKNGAKALLYLFATDPTDTIKQDTVEVKLGYINFETGIDSLKWSNMNDSIFTHYAMETEEFVLNLNSAKQLFLKNIEPDSVNLNLNLFGNSKVHPGKVAMDDLIHMSNEELNDKYEIKGFFPKLYISQTAKIVRNPGNALTYVLTGFSWVAILFIPFMALFQKLLYIRRPYYYVEHLVFVTHCTSFLFLLLILVLVLEFIISSSLTSLLMLLFPAYLYLAIKRYYRQGRIKSVAKWLAGLNISLILIFSLAALSIMLRILIY